MKTRYKIVLPAVALFLAIIQAGCSSSQRPFKIVLPPDFENKPPQSAANQNRFVQKEKGPDALTSAMEISEKYAQLSAEAVELRHQSQNIQAENQQLREKLKSGHAQLTQTQKELNEANNLLLEMRVELNNWKTNVLGFRDEMRQADITQLQTLQNILEILGGQVPDKLVADETQRLTDSTAHDPNQQ